MMPKWFDKCNSVYYDIDRLTNKRHFNFSGGLYYAGNHTGGGLCNTP